MNQKQANRTIKSAMNYINGYTRTSDYVCTLADQDAAQILYSLYMATLPKIAQAW